MSRKVHGNTKALPPSKIRLAEKLYHRKLSPDLVVPLEYAREIYSVASALGRRVGVLLDREARVTDVFLGTRTLLYLPAIQRPSIRSGRLNRLRLIYSEMDKPEKEMQIPRDIYTDLEKLRLDMVAGVRSEQNHTEMAYAWINPGSPPVQTEHVREFNWENAIFRPFIEDLERELVQQGQAQKDIHSERAFVVHVSEKTAEQAKHSVEELLELAKSAGVSVAGHAIQRRRPDPRTLLGKGKLEEVELECLRHGADLLIFDSELKPTQWRSITNSTDLRIIDRSMLILDIFSRRASSAEGKIQVELAQLKYNLPRLTEMDAGLSRLTGGIGARGPGETKLEISRRRSRDRIQRLDRQLKSVQKRRKVRFQKATHSGIPIVAILGYTNAGKSTLLNALTGSDALTEDLMFATLDPTRRKLFLSYSGKNKEKEKTGKEIILSDTVGFIRDLPEELLAAFQATLEELHDADLFLHLLDGSDSEIEQRKKAVEAILDNLNLLQTKTITVINKADLLSAEKLEDLCREFEAIPVSALKNTGFDILKESLYRA